MALLLPLVPLRLAAMALVLALFALMSSVAIAGWQMERPLPLWRRQVVLASRWLGGLILLLLGFWVDLRGEEHIRAAQHAGVKLLMFNHSSWVDTVVLLFLFTPSGVSRAANARIPVVGTCIRSFQNIEVPQASLLRRKADSDAVTQPLSATPVKGVVQQVADRCGAWKGWELSVYQSRFDQAPFLAGCSSPGGRSSLSRPRAPLVTAAPCCSSAPARSCTAHQSFQCASPTANAA